MFAVCRSASAAGIVLSTATRFIAKFIWSFAACTGTGAEDSFAIQTRGVCSFADRRSAAAAGIVCKGTIGDLAKSVLAALILVSVAVQPCGASTVAVSGPAPATGIISKHTVSGLTNAELAALVLVFVAV